MLYTDCMTNRPDQSNTDLVCAGCDASRGSQCRGDGWLIDDLCPSCRDMAREAERRYESPYFYAGLEYEYV